MSDNGLSKVYQLKIHLVDISPMVWRRILVRDDTSIAQLHGIMQLVMGWENIHLHSFRIYGKEYGIGYSGGAWFSDDPRKVKLGEFEFRKGDKFYYDYNFTVGWEHQIRVEEVLDPEKKRFYPVCIAGNQACPPEVVHSIEEFSELRDLFKISLYKLVSILKIQENIGYPWHADVFKRGQINKYLKQEDYDFLSQNDPYFPDRSRPYFEDEYWKRKDEFEVAKRVYLLLQREGIEAKNGYDAIATFLKSILELGKEVPKEKASS